jgi:hypothetical protein
MKQVGDGQVTVEYTEKVGADGTSAKRVAS